MKKAFHLVLIFTLLLVMLFPSFDINAQTLRDLKKELETLEAELKNTQQSKQLTKDEISAINKNINSISGQINQIQEDLKNINDEIVTLSEDIQNKNKEIKDIMNFVQVSSGESAYLEYTFGAQSFTDFIYRAAVAEQLAEYNNSLIQQYSEMIKSNNAKKEELATTTTNLISKQKQLDVELKKLGNQLSEVVDLQMSIEDDIKLQKEAIALYEDMGCGLDDDIKTCGREKLPNNTALFRPMSVGYATSDFGNRCFNLNGKWTCDFHTGIDLSIRPNTNVPIYAAGVGMVIAITVRSSCGGNVVYIHHKVNNQYYTTIYAHLKKVLINPGDVVDRNTVIGIMGGDPVTEYWDKCSTGAHLHFGIATGLYLKDYYAWSSLTARVFNARNIINFPKGLYNQFNDRITKY
jgi:peptidoglycan hydrolase CwlO-like protein